MSEKHTCCAKIYTGYWSKTCGKGAAYEHEGKWYCKTHHPPTVKAKDEARTAKWQAEWDALNQAKEKARAAAAEQKRRADCYDALVERVKELEDALSAYESARAGLFSHTLSNGVFNAWGKAHDCRALNDAHLQARAALSKSLPNTVAETTSGQAPAAGAGDVGEPEWKSEDFEVTLYPPMPTTGFLVGMPKGVKVLHKPTGLFATSEEERSQHRNRDVAWNKLQEMLADRTQAPAAIDARRAALAQKEQSP